MMPRKNILLAVAPDSLPILESAFSNGDKFDLAVTHSGLEACRIIKERQPHLVFMDTFMPGVNGDACCLSLKRENACSSTYIVLLADAGRGEDAERCRRALCDAILTKPIELEQLSAITYKLLYAEQKTMPRFKVKLAVFYGSGNQKQLTDYTVNMSIGGMFIETWNVLPIDTQLVVEFTSPANAVAITCKARVAWTNPPEDIKKPYLPPGIGLQFLDLSLESIHEILEVLDHSDLLPTW